MASTDCYTCASNSGSAPSANSETCAGTAPHAASRCYDQSGEVSHGQLQWTRTGTLDAAGTGCRVGAAWAIWRVAGYAPRFTRTTLLSGPGWRLCAGARCHQSTQQGQPAGWPPAWRACGGDTIRAHAAWRHLSCAVFRLRCDSGRAHVQAPASSRHCLSCCARALGARSCSLKIES